MGLAGFGKGFSQGVENGRKIMDAKDRREKRAERNKASDNKVKSEFGSKGGEKMSTSKVESRGADGATGAGAANSPDKKVKNLGGSSKSGTSSTYKGWE